MQLTERRSEGLLRVYDVIVPAAELQLKLDAKIEEVRPRVRINGFRPGKVPASHIRKVYGQSFMQDIVNEAVQSSTKQSLEKINARPASEPALDLKSDLAQVFSGQADLQFELSVELMPTFELVDLKSVSITRPVAVVGDEQVETALTELAAEHRAYEDKAGAAVEGDAVVLDFVGRIDGEAFEGGAAQDAHLVLGSKQFIPGFEDQLIGAKAGEKRSINVTFPEDYSAANLQGKAAVFEAEIKTVRAPKAGAPDDSWAQNLGFDDLAAVKAALRKRLETEHARQSRAKAKRALFDKLDAAHDFDLPPRMVDAEFNQIWRQVEADRAAGREDPSDAGKSETDLKSEYRDIAERRVRLGLVLATIGEQHKIQVTDEEVGNAISMQARNFPGQEKQIFEMYRRNPGMVANVRAPLYEEKVVDYVMELIQVGTQSVTRDALFAEDDPPTSTKKQPQS